MINRYVITWAHGEHIEPNIYFGRRRALNIVEKFIEKLRRNGERWPIAVRHEETTDGENWHRISEETVRMTE